MEPEYIGYENDPLVRMAVAIYQRERISAYALELRAHVPEGSIPIFTCANVRRRDLCVGPHTLASTDILPPPHADENDGYWIALRPRQLSELHGPAFETFRKQLLGAHEHFTLMLKPRRSFREHLKHGKSLLKHFF